VAPGLAERLGIPQRAVLGSCAALMVAAWGIVGLAVVTAEGGATHVVLIVASLCLAVGLTWWATELVVREWRGRVGVVTAAPLSGLATLSVLWLAVLVGNWAWPIVLMVLFGLPLGFGLLTTGKAYEMAAMPAPPAKSSSPVRPKSSGKVTASA